MWQYDLYYLDDQETVETVEEIPKGRRNAFVMDRYAEIIVGLIDRYGKYWDCLEEIPGHRLAKQHHERARAYGCRITNSGTLRGRAP